MQDEIVATDLDVFISYARADADHAVANPRLIGEWLKGEGYTVWWDDALLAGTPWLTALVRHATDARRVILLWSPRSATSSWVQTEARIAASQRKLVPLVIEDHPPSLEFHHLQFTKITDFEVQKADILGALKLKPSGKREPSNLISDNAQISIAALPTASHSLIGRTAEKALLAGAWASTAPGAPIADKTNVVLFHAIGGAGKTALMRHFLDDLADKGFAGARKVFGWSAHSQGLGDKRAVNADVFIAEALGFFGHDLALQPIVDPVERGRKLASLVGAGRNLLILDGIEPLQGPPHIDGALTDRGLAALINGLAAQNVGLLIITSRQMLPELKVANQPRMISHELDRLDVGEGVALLAHLGVYGRQSDMERAVEDVLGHALSINLLGSYLDAVHGGDVNQRERFKLSEIVDAPADLVGDTTARHAKRAARIMDEAVARFGALESSGASHGETEIGILYLIGLFDRPAEREALEVLAAEPAILGLPDLFHGLVAAHRKARWNVALDRLRKLKLLNMRDQGQDGFADAHPIVRTHFGARLKAEAPGAFREAHSRLYDFYRYRGLPQPFRTPEAYGLLALLTVHHDQHEAIIRQIGEAQWSGDLAAQIPPSLAQPNWCRLQEAAELIGTPIFKEARTKFLSDDLVGMQPCFSAIAHGCAAGRYREAYHDVYRPRLLRGRESDAFIAYLGALNADLTALSSFFDEVWSVPADGLNETEKGYVLHLAGFALRGLGRLREAARRPPHSTRASPTPIGWTPPISPAIWPSYGFASVILLRRVRRAGRACLTRLRAARRSGASLAVRPLPTSCIKLGAPVKRRSYSPKPTLCRRRRNATRPTSTPC